MLSFEAFPFETVLNIGCSFNTSVIAPGSRPEMDRRVNVHSSSLTTLDAVHRTATMGAIFRLDYALQQVFCMQISAILGIIEVSKGLEVLIESIRIPVIDLSPNERLLRNVHVLRIELSSFHSDIRRYLPRLEASRNGAFNYIRLIEAELYVIGCSEGR